MYATNRLDREKVEQLLLRHKKSFAAIHEKFKKGIITNDTPLYEIDDVVMLMYLAAIGHWANCQAQRNPKSSHSDRRGTELAKKYIKMAFVKKSK
jgi:hypothetical protein